LPKGAAAFGLGAAALAPFHPLTTLAHQASPEASPAAPQELDLANLSPGIPDPTEPVTISFSSWHTANSPVFESLRNQFQELHPNITVEFEDVPAEEATDRLTTRIAGGNPPDIAFMDQSAVVDFASRNALVDLSPYAEQSAAVVVEDYVQAFLQAALWRKSFSACQ
jgi:multiple sugar transport system substrate-binding protein